jgi:gas vesicle protein GvpG
MVLVDDILLFPVRSVLWIVREIHNAAQAERANERESLTAQLSSLYMMLETGKISEVEFEAEEKALLDRLESLQRGSGPLEEGRGGEEPQGRNQESRIA